MLPSENAEQESAPQKSALPAQYVREYWAWVDAELDQDWDITEDWDT